MSKNSRINRTNPELADAAKSRAKARKYAIDTATTAADAGTVTEDSYGNAVTTPQRSADEIKAAKDRLTKDAG